MRDNERRSVELPNHIRDRESLAGASDAEESLVPIASLDRFQQLGDSLTLIAARFVVRFELKRHLLL